MGDGPGAGGLAQAALSRQARRCWAECGWVGGGPVGLSLAEGAHGPATRSAAAPTAKGPRCSCATRPTTASIQPSSATATANFDLDRPRPQPAVARPPAISTASRASADDTMRLIAGLTAAALSGIAAAASQQQSADVYLFPSSSSSSQSSHDTPSIPKEVARHILLQRASPAPSRPACAVSCVHAPILTGRAALHATIWQRPSRHPQLRRRRDRRRPPRQVWQEPGAAVCATHQARCRPARHHRRGRRA